MWFAEAGFSLTRLAWKSKVTISLKFMVSRRLPITFYECILPYWREDYQAGEHYGQRAFFINDCETLLTGKLFSRSSCFQRRASTSLALGTSNPAMVRRQVTITLYELTVFSF
jgi:hypothetical protein